MDVNLINPILEAFTETLPQIGFQSVERKNLSLSGNSIKNSGILINIALVGQFKGVIMIGMDLSSAKQCASKMMMGMEVPEFDEMAQSAVSEMANMVCASACTRYSNKGITGLDISPPTLLIGSSEARQPVPETITVNFAVDDIPVNLHVGVMVK